MSATATCAICGRTILDGERIHAYVSVEGSHQVCPLCAPRAEAAGWLPADRVDAAALPAAPKRGLFDRVLGLRGREESDPDPDFDADEPLPEPRADAPEPVAESDLAEGRGESESDPESESGMEPEPEVEPELDPQPEVIDPVADHLAGEEPLRRVFGWRRRAPELAAPDRDSADAASASRPDPAGPGMRSRSRPLDDAEADLSPTARFERAILRFNVSDAGRTVAGLTRTLGPPSVSVGASASGPQDVRITVAWELSWYQWGVDLGDELRPVFQLAKGYEVAELDASAKQWNATAVEGRVAMGAPESSAGRGDAVRH